MKKVLDILLVAAMLAAAVPGVAEEGGSVPPSPPAMSDQGGQPPEMPGGASSGGPGGGMGMPGGGSSQPDSYDAVLTISDTQAIDTAVNSTGTDENAVLVVDGGHVIITGEITRVSDDSTGGDNSSFYGVGAAVLVTGGDALVEDTTITTDAKGGAGVFAYGDGVATVRNTTIITTQSTSGGIHVAGGGTLYAENLTIDTSGESSAAIRSDRGSGTMVVTGGSYTSHGTGSPAVYVTADITISDAELTATGSEALCLEGLNSVRLYNCTLSGAMPDLAQNDNTWTIILYQSMSGDSAVGEGTFLMDGGTLVSENGGLFYTTNTESSFVIRNVTIQASEDCEYFLRVTGNSNQRGWGSTGSNGADCVFTAYSQAMDGDIVWDSISTLQLYLAEGTTLTGAIVDDETNAGSGGNGSCAVTIDADSTWIVTGDSTVTTLMCAGTIADAQGLSVSIIGTDGTTYVQGDSAYTITVGSYSTEADLSGAGVIE